MFLKFINIVLQLGIKFALGILKQKKLLLNVLKYLAISFKLLIMFYITNFQ